MKKSVYFRQAVAPAFGREGAIMSRIRVLVGTRKGAFVLTADGKRQRWRIEGPHFPGWEVYHLKGAPSHPDRIYAMPRSSGPPTAAGPGWR